MSIQQFVNHIRAQVAMKYHLVTDKEIDAFFLGMQEAAEDNREALEKRDKMLRDMMSDIVDVEDLVKSATKVLDTFIPCDDDLCGECIHNGACSAVDFDRQFEWKYKNSEVYRKFTEELSPPAIDSKDSRKPFADVISRKEVIELIESFKVESTHELSKSDFERNDTLRCLQDAIKGVTWDDVLQDRGADNG